MIRQLQKQRFYFVWGCYSILNIIVIMIIAWFWFPQNFNPVGAVLNMSQTILYSALFAWVRCKFYELHDNED